MNGLGLLTMGMAGGGGASGPTTIVLQAHFRIRLAAIAFRLRTEM